MNAEKENMPNHSKRILTHVSIILLAFAAGLCAGVIFYPNLMGDDQVADAHDHGHPHGDVEEDPHAGEQIVQLTQAAVDNIKLEMAPVTLGDYTKKLTIPGEVIEIPGQSDLSVSAPIAGVVETVGIRSGESVGQGDALFTLRITDQDLTAAQAELLGIVAKLDVARSEIDRLTPLASRGDVSSSSKRTLEYQVQQLEVERQAKQQEILARGLPFTSLQSVLKTKQLAERITISVPQFAVGLTPSPADFSKPVGLGGKSRLIFSVSSLQAHPGMTVKNGDDLCHFAYHGRLYIKGEAFEIDLDPVSRIASNDRTVAVEFGHQHFGGHQHTILRDDLKILHIDNHVDPETQTFSFYIPLQNDVVQDLGDGDRVFRQWRFKPGQRAHIRVPVEVWNSQLKLPVEAVAMEGPNAVVFRRHVHDHADHADGSAGFGAGIGDFGLRDLEDDHSDHHDHANHDSGHAHNHDDTHAHDIDDHDHGDHDHGNHVHGNHDHDDHDHGTASHVIELEPVPVHVIYRDEDTVIIDPNGELKLGDEVALNNAYKLQLMLKMNASGGGGHHGHEH